MKRIENIKDLIEKAGVTVSEQTDKKILSDALENLEKTRSDLPYSSRFNVWRIIMKSKITRFAAAAVIIIFAGIVLSLLGQGTPTFAQVIEPILNARTVIFDFLVGDEETSPVIHEIVVGQRIRRTISNLPGMTMIIDLESSKMLVLHDFEKSAAYVDIKGQLQEKTRGYIKFIRNVLMKLKDSPNIQELGECQIDGQKAIGFAAKGPNEGVKIWADPKTAIPIRVELQLGQLFVILKNFKFDEPIDDSLMSMDAPAGYTLEKSDINLSDASEQHFIESLRIWAEVIRDGTFPDAIGSEFYMKQVRTLGEKIATSGFPEDVASQMGINFGKGMIFHQNLEIGGQWHYAGAGVKLGDADTPIFWYKPKDSKNWRVIYGDLSVKDVAPENLPK